MKTRIIAMLLVLCMVALALVSCGGDKTPDTTKAPTGNQGNQGNQDEEASKWDGVNFGGESIIISLSTYENADAVDFISHFSQISRIDGEYPF